jgi:hypothetical protein
MRILKKRIEERQISFGISIAWGIYYWLIINLAIWEISIRLIRRADDL